MSSKPIRVGDHVKLNVAGKNLFGRIKEDRGPLGVGGRRLYGIVLDMGEGDSLYLEMPAEEFEVIKPKKEKA
jgi:hypothetical protein